MTTNLLTTFILFSLYSYIGSILEERRLLAEFGDAYQGYQSTCTAIHSYPVPGEFRICRHFHPRVQDELTLRDPRRCFFGFGESQVRTIDRLVVVDEARMPLAA
jgi:hypothetical protein